MKTKQGSTKINDLIKYIQTDYMGNTNFSDIKTHLKMEALLKEPVQNDATKQLSRPINW
jgi:hypothetical protein